MINNNMCLCSCNCCKSQIIIKQIYCQNGNRQTIYSTFSNINEGATMSLNFGFELVIASITNSYISFILKDSVFGMPDQLITVNYGTFKMISLPARNGTYRIYIIL